MNTMYALCATIESFFISIDVKSDYIFIRFVNKLGSEVNTIVLPIYTAENIH